MSAKIDNHVVRILVDSGSVQSLISEKLADRLGRPFLSLLPNDSKVLFAAEGSRLKVKGYVFVEFNFKGLLIPCRLLVVSNLSESLLVGTDFLKENNVILNYQTGCATIQGDLLTVPMFNSNKNQFLVRLAKTTFLEPYSETLVPTICHKRFEQSEVLIEAVPSIQFQQFAVARSVNRIVDCHTVCRVLNFQPHPIVLHRGKVIATVENVNCNSIKPFIRVNDTEKANTVMRSRKEKGDHIDATNDELFNFEKEYNFKICQSLPLDEKIPLLRLLHKYKDVFARSLKEIKHYKHYELDLQLKPGAKPIFQKQFRLKPEDQKIIQSQLDEMVKNGLMEESQDHEWNSCLFTVSKRGTNEKRLICDLRNINKSIEIKTCSLPQMEDLISEIASKKSSRYSNIDLFKGYWQIKLAKSARGMCSVSSPNGVRLQPTVVPMGLVNSSQALVKILTHVMSKLIASSTVFLYMDDVICAESCFRSHLNALEDIFKTLRANDLVCNPAKCSFMDQDTSFLGMKISAQGVCPDPARTKIVQALAPAKSLKSAQRIFGLFNFFKRYIKNFAQRSYNLRQLLSKDKQFKWTEKCSEELEDLKNAVCNPPILKPFDQSKEAFLHCDSSAQGCGYVLYQYADDKTLPYVVAFGGHSLNKAQQMYSAGDLELLAVCAALKHYHHYLIGNIVNLVTDSKTVEFLHKLPILSNRHKRMWAFLMQFDIRTRHIPGPTNVVPDTISRMYDDLSPAVKVNFQVDSDVDDYIYAISTEPNVVCQNDQDISVAARTNPPDGWRAYNVNIAKQTDNNKVEISNFSSSATSSSLNPNALPFEMPNFVHSRSGCLSASLLKPTVVYDNDEQLTTSLVSAIRGEATNQPDVALANDTVSIDQTNNGQLISTSDSATPMVHQANNLQPSVQLTADDYLSDEEFKHQYAYQKTGQLTGTDSIDRITLLTAELYLLENDYLYRITTPRAKKQARVEQVQKRLCLPLVFRNEIISFYHTNLGHFSSEKQFLCMQSRFYFKTLYQDIVDFAKSCDSCLRSKRFYGQKTQSLHPTQVPSRPFEVIHIDLKNLTRKTHQGNVALAIAVCAFSKFPVVKAIPDYSAVTVAKFLVEDVISIFGNISVCHTDRGSQFTSELWREVAKLMNVKTVISSSLNPRSNGQAEAYVLRVSQAIKQYAENDLEIERSLPLISMALRASTHLNSSISPFECVFGRQMNLPEPISVPNFSPKTNGDENVYLAWLKNKLTTLHEGVKTNLQESKAIEKSTYDKAHSAQVVEFQPGSLVLLQDKRIKPRSDKVLTHQPWKGPFYIEKKVQSDSIGPAYLLIDPTTSRRVKSLISANRLRPYSPNDRIKFELKNPKRVPKENVANSPQTTGQPRRYETQRPYQDFEPALKILRQRKAKGKIQYLVLFENKESAWCDKENVTEALIKNYILRKRPRRRTGRN